MLRRSNCLPLLVLASVSIILLLSCTQSEDVVTPIATTDLVLKAERLPSPPPGMVYELWVAKSGDTVSLGKFKFDPSTDEFQTADGAVRSDTFPLTGDIMSYDTVMVSVELASDPDPASPGPIMLMDKITMPDQDPIRMRFPQADSLWSSNARFNLETPSDTNRNLNDGHGIWFSTYITDTVVIPDTTKMTWTLKDSILPGDSLQKVYRYQCNLSDTGYTSSKIHFGPANIMWLHDTLPTHRGVSFHVDLCVDTIPGRDSLPYQDDTVQVPTVVFDSIQSRIFRLDRFNQDAFVLPSVNRFGWHYKGWVVSANYAGLTNRWRLTKPAYRYNTANYILIPGDTGALFTTGSFSRLDQPDEADLFQLDNPVPPFPGEDFLNATALQAAFGLDSIDFVPSFSTSPVNAGAVFIALEPDNMPGTLNTNFPLIVLLGKLPTTRATITQNTVGLEMKNYTQTIPGNEIGFPEIDISLKRY
jgi:hypothetical protein